MLLLALLYLVLVVEHQLVDQQLGETEGFLVRLLILRRNGAEVRTRRLAQRRRGGRGSRSGQRRRRFGCRRRGKYGGCFGVGHRWRRRGGVGRWGGSRRPPPPRRDR